MYVVYQMRYFNPQLPLVFLKGPIPAMIRYVVIDSSDSFPYWTLNLMEKLQINLPKETEFHELTGSVILVL